MKTWYEIQSNSVRAPVFNAIRNSNTAVKSNRRVTFNQHLKNKIMNNLNICTQIINNLNLYRLYSFQFVIVLIKLSHIPDLLKHMSQDS